MYRVLIAGAGVFGVAIGQVAAFNDNHVAYLTNNVEVGNELLRGRFAAYAGINLTPPNTVFTDAAAAMQEDFDFLIIAVPSGAIPTVWEKISPHLQTPITVLNVAKGVNEHGVWSQYFMQNPHVTAYCALSGPSFAREVVQRERTLVNVFTADDHAFARCADLLNTPYFRVQRLPSTLEAAATEIGAIKNVIAIGLGMVRQMTESKDTAAALLTLAFQDLRHLLTHKYPACQLDLLQPYALGDILLTASSPMSRNYRFGQLAAQVGFAQAVRENTETVEGLAMLGIMQQEQQRDPLDLKFFQPLFDVAAGKIKAAEFLDVV